MLFRSQAIAAAVGATANFMGQYTIDCAKLPTLPDITFTIGGMPYTVPGKDIVLQVQNQCVFAFMGLDFPPGTPVQWILGDVFMRQYYTVFNYVDKTVGFAPAVQTKTLQTSDIHHVNELNYAEAW